MNQKDIRKKLLLSASLISVLLKVPSSLSAQEVESMDPLTQLMSRVSAIEAENRELRGKLEETKHELSTLNKQMETLNADVEYRLNNADAGDAMPLPLPPSQAAMEDDNQASLSPSNVDQEYEKARSFLEQGEYEAAERAFAAFVGSHPKDKQAGAAQYWLGVTYFVRGAHEKAVAAFAKGYKNYPKSPKAADNLLKLAKSLAALDRKADACTTLDQLISEHPKSFVKEVGSERKKLNCK